MLRRAGSRYVQAPGRLLYSTDEPIPPRYRWSSGALSSVVERRCFRWSSGERQRAYRDLATNRRTRAPAATGVLAAGTRVGAMTAAMQLPPIHVAAGAAVAYDVPGRRSC